MVLVFTIRESFSNDWEKAKLDAWADLETAIGYEQLQAAFPSPQTFMNCIDYEMDTTFPTLAIAIGCAKYGPTSTPNEIGTST